MYKRQHQGRFRRRVHQQVEIAIVGILAAQDGAENARIECCLLYTSDAADERSSVDLGGRRIIKKKNDGRRTYKCGRVRNEQTRT